MSRIHAILLVKNEADIIRESLEHALPWIHRVYVLDNGSTDGTWELIQEMAKRHPGLIPFAQTNEPFDNGLRARVFDEFRHESTEGDWWLRLDADEFYMDDPPAFLARVPERHHVVWTAHLQYYFTEIDLGAHETNPQWQYQPVLGRLSHYLPNAAEARFFRYRPGLLWPSGAWPRHMGVVHPRRIRVRHYQYRSPDQITRRLQARFRQKDFDHVSGVDWKSVIRHSAELLNDNQPVRIDENSLPRHLEPWHYRLIKHFMHKLKIWP